MAALKPPSPRLQALLWLTGVALLALLFGASAAKDTAPLPPDADRLSALAEKALTGVQPFAWLLLALTILLSLLLWRRARLTPTPLSQMPPTAWTPSQVAALTLSWLVGQAAASLALYLHPSLSGQTSLSQLIALVWLLGTLLGLFVPLWFVFRGRLPSLSLVGLHLPHKGMEFLWGYLAFFTFPPLVLVGVALTSLVTKFDPLRTNPVFSVAFASTSPLDWLILFLLVSLLGPILEEFLFRGLLYRSLRNLWSPTPAIIISALFFSAIHPSPATLLPVALLGTVLAYLYEKTGSLVPGIVAHGLYNGSTLAIVLYLQRTLT